MALPQPQRKIKKKTKNINKKYKIQIKILIRKQKQTNKNTSSPSFPPLPHLFIHLRDIGSCCASLSMYALLCKQLYLQMFTVQCTVGQVQGLWLVIHHQYWTLIDTPLGYPTVARSPGGPVLMVLQDQSLHML